MGRLTPPVQRSFREFESRGCGAGHVTAGGDAAAGRRGGTRGGVAAPRLAEVPKGRGLEPECWMRVEPRRVRGEDGISSCRGNQAILGLSLVFSQGSDLKPGVSL